MTDKNTELNQEQVFDPLDMNNYKVEKLPKMEKSGFEKWMARLGGPDHDRDLVYHHGMLKKVKRGINEIMRLHLTRFTQKMDNAEVPIDTMDADGNLTTYSIQKIYHVHIIFQLQHDGETEYHQFRISMTRNGVQAIDEI